MVLGTLALTNYIYVCTLEIMINYCCLFSWRSTQCQNFELTPKMDCVNLKNKLKKLTVTKNTKNITDYTH